ncbi:MAG: 23S rRNA (pseudouridine(1915)-N(3))-methyltransferase RlmH [Bdellovibrionales bacterium]|nr:23S rRNA (pseudouridine(1915)-N(3))-methyltransferase RlmH [Bdellovibrionales bacterium]
MRIDVIAFGKLKAPGLRECADHYLKLASRFIEIEEREIKPLQVSEKSSATRALIQEKEAALLLTAHKSGDRSALYLLDEGGKLLRTEQWADLVRTWQGDGLTRVTLALGSSLGFSPTLKSQARGVLSLGPQTLPHELARVVLYEQLFRCTSLIAGHPYHVEG